jgi:hypothetical protein
VTIEVGAADEVGAGVTIDEGADDGVGAAVTIEVGANEMKEVGAVVQPIPKS